jgi:hypothetical protein
MSIRKPESMARSLSHEVEEFSRGRRAVVRVIRKPRSKTGGSRRVSGQSPQPACSLNLETTRMCSAPAALRLDSATLSGIGAENVSSDFEPLQKRFEDVLAQPAAGTKEITEH